MNQAFDSRATLDAIIDESHQETWTQMSRAAVDITEDVFTRALARQGITGTYEMTVRWMLAFNSGIECARTGGSRELWNEAGPELFRHAAGRFASMLGIDVPSAWILGLEEQHRIQENRST
jgi:hypothetical protein